MNLIRPKLSKLFYDSGPKKTIPKCAIKVVPWFHSEAVFHSYSESKSISCKVPSLQMLPFFVENFGPKYTEWTTTAHEQLPGHHLEVIHSKTRFKQKFISFLFRRIHVTRFMLYNLGNYGRLPTISQNWRLATIVYNIYALTDLTLDRTNLCPFQGFQGTREQGHKIIGN